MVQGDKDHRHKISDVSEPCKLLRLLLVSFRIQLAGKSIFRSATEHDVPPGHEGHLFTLRIKRVRVARLDQQVLVESSDLVTKLGVLLVLRHALELHLLRAIGDGELDHLVR